MPPNQFHMRNLLGKINENRLATALKNNTTNTRANRNTGRLKRMNASRKLVKRRAFRFSNDLTEGPIAPTTVFGTNRSNSNRNKNYSLALAESRKGMPKSRPKYMRPSLNENESRLYAQVVTNRNTLQEIEEAIQTLSVPNATKRKLYSTALANYSNL